MKQQLDLEVKKFFDLLANTPSIKVKKQLLAEKRDDGNIKKFLDYLLNPFFVTGISEKKIRKVVSVEKSVHFHSFHELMTYVRKNHTGSDDVLANTQAYLDDVNPELRMFYIGIIAFVSDVMPKLLMTHSDMSSSPSGKCSKPIKSEN